MNNPMRYRQLAILTSALGKEVMRQPAVLFWGILFPILIALGLGIAFTKPPDIIHNVALIETNQGADNGSISQVATTGFDLDTFLETHGTKLKATDIKPFGYKIRVAHEKLGETTFFFLKTNKQHAMVLLKQGKVSVLLEEKDNRLTYRFDPHNAEAKLTYLSLVQLFNQNKINHQAANETIEPLTVKGTRYIDFLVPGIMSMGIMMSCMWGLSYGMIDKRSKKLLRRMVATPMKKSYFLIALMIVRIVMNIIEAGLLFMVAYLVFHISIQGSILAFGLIFFAGNIAFGGIAIFVSSRTSVTEIGNGLINAVVMPMMVLSGVFFSYHNFPDWCIPVIRKLPLTLLADGIRSIFIQGAGLAEIALPFSLLVSMGIISFMVGLKIFKWH